MQTSLEAMCKIQAKSTHTSTKVKKYGNKNFSKPPIPSNQKSSIPIFSQQKWWNNSHKKRKEKISSKSEENASRLSSRLNDIVPKKKENKIPNILFNRYSNYIMIDIHIQSPTKNVIFGTLLPLLYTNSISITPVTHL